MAWLSSKVFVAVIVVEYRCEVPLNEGDSDFSCLNFVQANIGRVSLLQKLWKADRKSIFRALLPFW